MAKRIIHVCLDVQGALLNWSPRDFRNLMKHPDGRPMDAREAKALLLNELAEGHKMVPFGEPCEGFSYETGCPGHDQPEDKGS